MALEWVQTSKESFEYRAGRVVLVKIWADHPFFYKPKDIKWRVKSTFHDHTGAFLGASYPTKEKAMEVVEDLIVRLKKEMS